MNIKYSDTIDSFYKRINDNINLVESYSQKKGIAFLIKSCRLKPYELLFKSIYPLKLHKQWIDEYGNCLYIGKHIRIVRGDLSINRNKIGITDIYYGLDLSKIIKMSKFCAVIVGIDEDLDKECYIINLLGIDNYFRTFMYYNEEIFKISTLTCGIDYLLGIVNNRDIRHIKRMKSKKFDYMKEGIKSFVFGLPIQKSVLYSIEEINNGFFNFLRRFI